MAQATLDQGGHYALKLKGNNGPLQACAIKAFEQADAEGGAAFCETMDQVMIGSSGDVSAWSPRQKRGRTCRDW